MHKILMLGSSLAVLASPAFAAETVTYTYDEHGRVVKVEKSAGPQDGAKVEYQYDNAHNRTNRTVTPPP